MSIFISNLAPSLLDFLSFKNALGIEYKTGQVYLRQLDLYNYEHGNHNNLTKEIAEEWANQHANKSTTQDRSWISPIREYGRFLRSIGDHDAYILDNRYTIQRYHAEVYLMTNDEIQSFFKECDSYVLKHKSLGRPYVLPALYRFLYCCGTRCAEVRNLTCENVHLDKGYVDILQLKAHRDRRLYLSNELILYLKRYNKAIETCFPSREYFFPGGNGGICSSTAISANFRNIWISAGLKRDGKVKSRAYDFRHHFACANIMRWSMEGKNVHAMLPYLMRYMGHSSLESTYYYIHLIPDYFPQYSILTAPIEDLIPEVEEYEI
ncbi:MAG TPA: tyrosine-type recombinase/integrase [Anaerovoracaceae bacterium]|nr:tyrosine-type recombinase/integrase [Anaerovoracaceae bacterium]